MPEPWGSRLGQIDGLNLRDVSQGRGEMKERTVMKTAARAVVIDPDPLWQQAVTAAL